MPIPAASPPPPTTESILADLVVTVNRLAEAVEAINKDRVRSGQVGALKKALLEQLEKSPAALGDLVQAMLEAHTQKIEDSVAYAYRQQLLAMQTMVGQVRQGLYVFRLNQGDSEALGALSRVLDLFRHAVYAQLGGRPFEEAVELAAPVEIMAEETDKMVDRRITKHKDKGESSIQFKTQGGSEFKLALGDAKKWAGTGWHFGKMFFKTAAHGGAIAGGALWLLHRLLTLLGYNVG